MRKSNRPGRGWLEQLTGLAILAGSIAFIGWLLNYLFPDKIRVLVQALRGLL